MHVPVLGQSLERVTLVKQAAVDPDDDARGGLAQSDDEVTAREAKRLDAGAGDGDPAALADASRSEAQSVGQKDGDGSELWIAPRELGP